MEEEKSQLNKIKEEGMEVKTKIREQSMGYIFGALGLVAGLAWNEAIKTLIDIIFPLGTETVWAKFVYAVLITVFVVMATIIINKFLEKKRK